MICLGRIVALSLGIVLLQSVGGGTEMSSTTKTQITSGITEFKNVVDGMEKLASNKKLIGNIQQLSGYLGVAGGIISFALLFVPAQDSAELKYMKEKFSEVNMKLDRITTELDNVKDMITLENQRAAYIGEANKIVFGYKQLTENYLTEMASITSCTTSRDCLRQRLRASESYKNTFNVKASLFSVLTGTAQSTSVFGDPLLDLIKKTYKCDVGKVLNFADGVIKLAFKGQQVVLAYEKLTGTNTSISLAMKDWSDMVYNLRMKVEEVKTFCYNNIKSFIDADVKDTKYQTGMSSNKVAADSMKSDLETKYPWLYWTVISYGAFGGKKHWGFSSFINMPSAKEARKRVLRVVAQDKGTYNDQRQDLSSLLDSIVKGTVFPYNAINHAERIYNKFEDELKKTTMWRKLQSFMVLNDYNDLQVAVDAEHNLYHYNDELSICFRYYNGSSSQRCTHYDNVRIWASLESEEQIIGAGCSKSCSGKGSCIMLPYSTSSYCKCNSYYGGDDCQHYDKIKLATSVDSMLAVTAQIPKLTDIYFELLDMQDFIGASLTRVQDSITALDAKLQMKFDDLNARLTNEFQWANLITKYSATIQNLKYYLHLFQGLNSSDPSYPTRSVTLAQKILKPEYIEKWMFEFNFLIVGRSDFTLLAHKPLMFVLMDKHKVSACTTKYKDGLDSTWRQLVILQNQGYIMWAQAKTILDQSSDYITAMYKSKTADQESFMKRSTCELSISKSTNVKCSGGFYIYPKLSIVNQCENNYYIAGATSTSCERKSSSCNACNCNYPHGSSRAECNDITGTCSCINSYYGKTCRDRDCKWTGFGGYGPCSKRCGYGGRKTRSRSHKITQKGQGRHCTGGSSESLSCFNGCCSGSFHCTANKKCISGSMRCDYDNNCGNAEDERSCYESCQYKYTGWNSHGKGDAVYLDRHRINCGSSNYVLKMFKIERSGSKIRYKYLCCKLFKSVCSLRKVVNGYTYDGKGDTVYLDRQSISCGSNGVLNDYWLSRNSKHDHWRYNYYCCDMNSKYRPKLSCYSSSTSFTYDGKGRNYYLDRQTLSCNNRYFLQYFRLNRNNKHDHWRYLYRCCRITT